MDRVIGFGYKAILLQFTGSGEIVLRKTVTRPYNILVADQRCRRVGIGKLVGKDIGYLHAGKYK